MSAQTRLLIADDSDSVRGAIRTLLESEPGIAITGEARDYPEPENSQQVHSGRCLDGEITGLAFTYGAIKLLDKTNLASILMPAIKECTRR
jgi:hypothetical protein